MTLIVLIASLVGQSPTLRRIIEACYRHEIQLVLSKALLWEIGRVLHKPKLQRLHRLNDTQISAYLQSLAAMAEFVPGSTTLTVSPDEADNALFICAVEAQADYIISGDKPHVLAIAEYQGVRTIRPSDFVTRVLVREPTI